MDIDKEIDIARAWKDEEYRNSLTPEQIAKLPPNPAGDVELNEEELDNVSGGACPRSNPLIPDPNNHSIF